MRKHAFVDEIVALNLAYEVSMKGWCLAVVEDVRLQFDVHNRQILLDLDLVALNCGLKMERASLLPHLDDLGVDSVTV